jgi:putative chitinase
MQLNSSQLASATGCGDFRADAFCAELNAAMLRYKIDSPRRTAHFLAQVAVDSRGLSSLEEDLSYCAEHLVAVWPARFRSVADATPYARNPEALAELVHGGRCGNTQAGDGWRYRGRGLTRVTGRANYRAYYRDTGVNVLAHPDILLERLQASYAAAWFWKSTGCSALADAGDVRGLTLRITGELTGLGERETATERALGILA